MISLNGVCNILHELGMHESQCALMNVHRIFCGGLAFCIQHRARSIRRGGGSQVLWRFVQDAGGIRTADSML